MASSRPDLPAGAPAAPGSVAQPSPEPGAPDGPGAPPPSAGLSILPPLDQLLAPIALYPDPLIGLILPSATTPADLTSAAQFLGGNGDPNQIAMQSWNDAVKGLAHYPAVLEWMSENLVWTQQLGFAYASEPAAVMDAIQDLRRRAQAAGSLKSGAQQQVVTDNGAIQIEPAQPNVIYVPSYDPDLVYFAPPPGYYPDSYFYWGNPYPMGIWMTYDFDWGRHAMWRGDWYTYRGEHGGWGHPVNYGADVRFHGERAPERWNPPAAAPRWSGQYRPEYAPRGPMRGAPAWNRGGAPRGGAPRGGGEDRGRR